MKALATVGYLADPAHCHRSLLARALHALVPVKTVHLRLAEETEKQ